MSQDVYSQWLEMQKQWVNQASNNQFGGQNSQWKKSYTDWLNLQENAWNQFQQMANNVGSTDLSNFPFNNLLNVMNIPGMKEFDQLQKQSVEVWKNLQAQNPMNQYLQNIPNLNTMMNQLQNLMPSYSATNFLNNDFAATYRKMYHSQQLYNNFYKIYELFNERFVQPGLKETDKLMNEFKERHGELYKTLVEPFIPEQVKAFLNGPQQLLNNLVTQADGFWSPWKDSLHELIELYTLSLSGDTSKLSEFYDVWQEQYNKTFGAYMQSPIFGNNAEVFEQQNKFLDTLVRLLVVSSEFASKINKITQTHIENKMKDYLELVEKNEHPKTYKEFYVYWSNTIEKTLNAYFYTDEFSEMLGEFSEAYALVKVHQDELLSKYFANTPFVLEKDMQSVYKKLYDLRKEVRALKKELKAVNNSKEPEKATTAKSKK